MRVLLSLFLLLFAAPVLAADWQVDRVRGAVTQKISGSWQRVSRGDIVPNDRYLKTGVDGRIGLSRGIETIELQGDTQIRIQDAGAERMTTVLQDFGTVSIEAERRNVQHFSVQTPFLAAVVKGTRFTVRSDKRGATVEVERGVVQVQDTINDLVVDVRPGQEATVTSQAPLVVEGAGAISVFSFEGIPVVNGSTTLVSDSVDAAAGGSAAAPGNSAVSNAGGNGKGNAFGLAKAAASSASDAAGAVSNAGSNAGRNSNSNSSSNASSNAAAHANASSAVAASAAAAVETVTTTVESVTESILSSPGNSGNSNAGGNGNGNALGLNK